MRRTTLALLLALAAAAPVRAQVTLSLATDVRGKPGGAVVALLSPGAKLSTGPAAGAETQVTFEGWVDASRLGAKRDSFPASVSGRLTLRVRAQPSSRGAIIAVLQPGVGLHTISREGAWARVRRSAWIPTAALERSATAAAAAQKAGQKAGQKASAKVAAASPAAGTGADGAGTAAPAEQPIRAGASGRPTGIVSSGGARFRDLPVGRILGGMDGGTSVEIVARQSGWVRVRADGWIPEKDLVSGENVSAQSVTAADLRADPQGMKGHIVQWNVEVMSLQIADPLRVELARDEPYLLARGPGEENTLLYLAVPGTLLTEARALPPLARLSITARVRSGRSEPAGTPILDLLSIARR
jgi:SH3-like domain-containing protein